MNRLLRLICFSLLLLCVTSTFVSAQPTDMLNIQQAQIVNSPDVRNWPVTTALTAVSFDGAVTRVDFTKKDGANRWPDVTPPGWSGPLEYTLWLFVNNNGQWVGSGFIQFWNGRDGSGTSADPDVPSIYHAHWYYAERWAPIFGHGPIKAGEQIGFMVTSGNQRDSVGPDSVHERSNVVVFAATDNGHYSFAAAPVPVPTPTPVPTPVPVPTPTPVPPPVAPVDVQAIIAATDRCTAEIKASRAENQEAWRQVKSVWQQLGEPVLKYVVPAVVAFFGGKAIAK